MEFPLLPNSAAYEPNTFNYLVRPESLAPGLPDFHAWIEVFRKSIPTFRSHALTDDSVPAEQRQEAAEAFATSFAVALDALDAQPEVPLPHHPTCYPLCCLALCELRERCLRAAGFKDIFLQVKATENAAALNTLPSVLAHLDACQDMRQRLDLTLRGVFAGNIFDLGAAGSAARFQSGLAGSNSFAVTRDSLVARPWAVDDLDAAVEQLAKGSYKRVLMFVDNAGSDVVLGMLPLARVLVQLNGAQVLIVANELPSINDITAAELQPLLQDAARLDPSVLGPAVSSGQVCVMSSGSDLPVLDLRRLAPALCEDVRKNGCDLVILEGMGRSIETNLHVQLTCDSLKLGMIKHPEVAALLQGRMYDCVCKFTPGAARGGAAASALLDQQRPAAANLVAA